MEWPPFFKVELKNAINKCSSLSTPGPDYILWNYLKEILNDIKCCSNILNIANIYINPSYWPNYLKKSLFIIISKLNKFSYNILKAFHPIVLLNMLGKLIEKVISSRLQVHSIVSNLIHPSQLGDIKQHLTMNTSIFLTHVIYIE